MKAKQYAKDFTKKFDVILIRYDGFTRTLQAYSPIYVDLILKYEIK